MDENSLWKGHKNRLKTFALIGVAGYVAPKHLKAIKDVGGSLVACLDPHDSVGILDSYFPDASFFTEFERFDRHLEKLARNGEGVDYVSICSPNYLHDAHVRFAMRIGAHAICEKPLVLAPWNIDALHQISQEYERNINTILQLRLHPEIVKLKKEVEKSKDRFKVTLFYHAPRGVWYEHSWKANVEKSGGMIMNIGIHFFDLLLWVFGRCESSQVLSNSPNNATGELTLKQADVQWHLSTKGEARRILQIEDETIDLSTAIDLHTESYKHILELKGWTPHDVKPAISLVHEIRNSK